MMKTRRCPTRVYGYVRVSTDEQASRGISMDAQAKRIRQYAALHGLELLGVVADNGASARKIESRAGLRQVLKDLRGKKAGGIIVAKLDRLSRSVRDILDLVGEAERKGWEIHSIAESLDTSTAHGRFTLTIMAALGEMERDKIVERTKEALAHLRAQGKRTSGKPPFGYRFKDGREVENKTEQKVLKSILRLRKSGLGAYRIVNWLNERDILNPRGKKPWTVGTMQSVLKTANRRGAAEALAQLEREHASEQIGARTREALDYLRTQGKRTSGKPPFGYRFARGHEVEVRKEQAVLEEIIALRAEGNGALRVANALNARGQVNPRTGKPWTRGSVQSIMSTAERRSA